MAQKTFVSLDVLTASDVNTYLAGEGGAWTSFTPTVAQLGAVTVTNTRSRYARYGRTIHFSIQLSVTGSGTGANAITVLLPVTAASTYSVAGSGYLYDLSTTTVFPCVLDNDSTTTTTMRPTSVSGGAGSLGAVDFTAGLAAGDIIRIAGTYEAAS